MKRYLRLCAALFAIFASVAAAAAVLFWSFILFENGHVWPGIAALIFLAIMAAVFFWIEEKP